VLPRALRLKRPLHHCNACDPYRKPVDMLHNPLGGSDRFPAGGGALVRFDFHEKVAALDGLAPSTSRVRAGRTAGCATGQQKIRQPELHRPLAVTNGARRCQRFGGISKTEGQRMTRIETNGVPMRLCSFVPIRSIRWQKSGRASRCCPGFLADPNGADCCFPHARGLNRWSHGESHPDLRPAMASSCC
jgi:hypothetical protein